MNKKTTEQLIKKSVREYGYNTNDDPYDVSSFERMLKEIASSAREEALNEARTWLLEELDINHEGKMISVQSVQEIIYNIPNITPTK